MSISLSYSLRALSREPFFACIVILMLAVGIGATTTIFAVIDEVLLSALPYREADGLVMIWESNPAQAEPAGSHIPAARDNFDAWRKEKQSFEAIEAYRQTSFNLTGLRTPEQVDVARATPGFLPMLGTRPMLGRTFLPEEEDPGRNRVVVLSQAFFRAHFQRPDALGQTLLLDGVPYTVIGVLPKEFHLPNILQGLFEYKPDLWIPLSPITTADPPIASKRRNLLVYARLKGDVSLTQARTQMRNLAERLARDNPILDSGYSANVFPLEFENIDPDLRRALYILWAAVAFVMLLVCANLASLMLIRVSNQQKDIAIMTALGASRWELMGTIMSQGLILSFAGTVLGAVASYGGVRLIAVLKPNEIHAVERITLNVHSLVFTALLFIAIAAFIAWLPAWLTSRGDLVMALKQSRGMRVTAKPRFQNRSLLVSAEVAIALVLAIGSTLLIRSFVRRLQVNTGFGAHRVLTAHLSLPQPRYGNPEDQVRFCNRLIQDLRSLPRVEAASLIDNMPLYAIRYAPFEIEGRSISKAGEGPIADYANVTPDFFQTMEIPVRSGRHFASEDAEDHADKVVIINETLARKLWPSQNPVGTHIRSLDGGTGPWATIVGVVADFVQFNVASPPRPELFWPAKRLSSMTVVVRTADEPLNTSSALQRTLWEIDKDQPISDIQTLDGILRNSTSQAEFNAAALSIFAGLGVLLAVVGVYGLISYLVSSRTQDIGVRLALGAQKSHIFSSLLRQILPFVVAGILIGVALSLLSSKVITRLVFGITSLDPMTYVVATLGILTLMLVTIFFPARRATQIEPAITLRGE